MVAKSIALEPDQLYRYTNQAEALFIWGDLMRRKKRLLSLPHITRRRRRLCWRDKAGMEKLLAESRGNNESEMVLAQVQALAAARDGQLKEADRYSRGAIEMAQSPGSRFAAPVRG